jgi:membrane protein YqaA with SNARE-associated domain
MAVILIAVVSTSAIVLREELDRFRQYGYLGAFLVSMFGSATVIAGIPSVPFVFALGAVLNPWYLGLAAGAGEAIGEFVIYMAGRTGHAFFLKDRFIEVQNNKDARGIYPRLQRWVHAKGALALFLSSAVFNPFFSLIGATAGATRFPAWKFFGAVWAGKTVKWMVISLLAYAILGKIVLGLLHWLGM